MDNEILYEETIEELLDLLKKTIVEAEASCDIVYEDYNNQPTFSITSSSKLPLLKFVTHFGEHQVRYKIASLCKELCLKYNFEVLAGDSIPNVDFIEVHNGKKIGYRVSTNEEHMIDMKDIERAAIEKVVIIVLKRNICNMKSNSNVFRAYKQKNTIDIENITLEDYFERVCPGEYKKFQKYIEHYNYEAQRLLGLTISPIPTKTALEKKREKVQNEFSTYFFEDCLTDHFSESEIKTLKINFSKNEFAQILKTDYTDSLVSSEWYYDLYIKADGELEQTAIISGYLKSVEQFLFSVMLSKSDIRKFKLEPNKKKSDKKYDEKYITLTVENQSSLLTMGGKLLASIKANYKDNLDTVYLSKDIGEKTQTFLQDYFDHTRNGYFHKDNIYDSEEEKIKRIRKETYGAYFLIASAFK